MMSLKICFQVNDHGAYTSAGAKTRGETQKPVSLDRRRPSHIYIMAGI